VPFKIRKILVAVADGSATKVVDRAADLASHTQAQVELFSVAYPEPAITGLTGTEQIQITRAIITARQVELEKLASRLHRRGVRASCTVVSDSSVTDSIVSQVKRSNADMVAIEAHKHNFLARLLLSQTDYDLIRQCPVPLLIVKGAPTASRRPVLAALDPWHANDKPRSLDARIIAAGREIARVLGLPLHTAHIYPPLPDFAADGFVPVAVPISPPEDKKYAAAIRRQFKALNLKYEIPARNTHLEMGDPAFQLPQMVKSLKARVLVMGAVSRSAVKRILIGNTAERVLDAVPCDVLIVKPPSFRPAVR
jgi:universal stress protein E